MQGTQKGRKRRRSFYEWLMKTVGTGYPGNDGNPPEPEAFRYKMASRELIKLTQTEAWSNAGEPYQVFAPNNDGTELWMGYANKWKYSLSGQETRALFWWLLWEWYAKARWFGLRRPIYYWALHRHVARFR